MKYGNKKTVYNGRLFHSKKEALFARQLDMLKRATDARQRVVEIEYQPKFPIVVNGQKVCEYWGDFRVRFGDNRVEVIDVKSEATKTPVYRLKKKLVLAVHGVEIVEV